MLGTLAWLGLLPVEEPVAPPSGTDVLLGGFARYLREERGLASSTAKAYLALARRFLADYSDDGDLRGLASADVSAAVLGESVAVSAGSVQYFGTALRALLRYGHVAGLIEADLSAAALPVNAHDEFLRAVAAHLSESPSDAAVAAVVNAQLNRNLTPMFLTDSAPTKGTTP